jgi:hypothetical protein
VARERPDASNVNRPVGTGLDAGTSSHDGCDEELADVIARATRLGFDAARVATALDASPEQTASTQRLRLGAPAAGSVAAHGTRRPSR